MPRRTEALAHTGGAKGQNGGHKALKSIWTNSNVGEGKAGRAEKGSLRGSRRTNQGEGGAGLPAKKCKQARGSLFPEAQVASLLHREVVGKCRLCVQHAGCEDLRGG